MADQWCSMPAKCCVVSTDHARQVAVVPARIDLDVESGLSIDSCRSQMFQLPAMGDRPETPLWLATQAALPGFQSIRTGPARQPGRCNTASDACGRLAERCPRAQECTQAPMEAKGGHPMKSYGHFINGSYVDPAQGRWIDSLNPYTGEV